MTTGSQPHGARWPRFNCTDNSDNELGGSYAEKDDNEHSLLVYRDEELHYRNSTAAVAYQGFQP